MFIRIANGSAAVEFTRAYAAAARNELLECDDNLSFFVDGKPATRLECIAACEEVMQAAFDKKSQTHKRVRISQGATACSNTYREVWVKRK